MAKRINSIENQSELPKISVEVPKIIKAEIVVTLIGDSPLICHNWSERSKRAMLDKHMKKARTGKLAKDPEQDFKDCLYNHPEGGYGFPSIAFKKSAVDAATFIEGAKKTEMRGAFHIEDEYVKLEGTPNIREDMTRVGNGVADIRHRAEFKLWKVKLHIVYNKTTISAEQIVNLFNNAGFSIGIGDWRPQKNGPYGRFHVKLTSD